MYCPKCGAMMDGDTCAFCGAKAASGGAPQGQQAYGGYGGAPANPYASAPRSQSASFSDYFVPNLIMTILGCAGGGLGCIFPIIGLIYSVGARDARVAGDWATARSKASVAKTMFWISIGLILLGIVILVVLATTGNFENVQ